MKLSVDVDGMTLEQLTALAKKKAHDNAAFIPEDWVSMTQATECLWGTSGRGNPNCVKVIEACARLGEVEIKVVGRRSRMVRRTPTKLSAVDILRGCQAMERMSAFRGNGK